MKRSSTGGTRLCSADGWWIGSPCGNLGQIQPDDFEGGQRGLRMRPEALKRYFERYEEQLRTPSEGAESPSWRERLKHQVEAVREMVMAGEPAPFYQWPG